jgi:hypothetical protein
MACTGSAGYQGYLRACNKVLPYLNADLTKVTELYMSNTIHGGGSGNINPVFRSQHNFAQGRITVEGSVTTEVFGGTGNYATAFLNVLSRAIPTATDDTNVCNGFDSTCKLIFSPGGGSEIVLPDPLASTGKALIQSLELRGNNGGNVQATFRIISAGATYNETAANTPAASELAFETDPQTTDDSNPIPYWASTFAPVDTGETNVTTTLADQITDWSITINNNPTPIYTFNGEQFAQDIVLGMLNVTGTFSYYSPNGKFVEKFTHGANLTITFGSITLTIPYMAFGASPIPSPGPNSATIRNVTFTGLARSSSEPAIYRS